MSRRHTQERIAFVDIDAHDYRPAAYAGISYRQAMGRIHAINARGVILKDVAVFREAYRLIGLGWLYAPTQWPLLGGLVNGVYGIWADRRLQFTGRGDLDSLCREREGCSTSALPIDPNG